MNLSNKPHDHLFKSTFSDKRIATDYIRNFLPTSLSSRLDLSTLELTQSSYVNSDLKEYFSDVVYRCSYGEEEINLSLLFEHKSKPDGIIYLQLLRYLLEAWTQPSKKKGGLKIIVPIVVYHGKENWKKRAFSSFFPGLDENLMPFIPNFDYVFTNLADWTDEALMSLQVGLLKNTLLILKHFKEVQYTQQHIDRLFWGVESYIEDPSQKEHIRIFWSYLYQTHEHKQIDFRKLIEKLSTSLKEEAMTIYEKAVKEGKIEGKLEGKTEQQNIFIINALEKGFDISTISQLTSLPETEVVKRIQELGLKY